MKVGRTFMRIKGKPKLTRSCSGVQAKFLSSKPRPNGLDVYEAQGSSSPISVLIVPSPFELDVDSVWKPTRESLVNEGYETGVFKDFYRSNNTSIRKRLPNHIEALSQAINSMGPQTVLVAPSISGFIAQKYLESHPAAGMVLINPFPPNSSQLVEKMFQYVTQEKGLPFSESNLKKIFGYKGLFESLFSATAPKFIFPPELLFGTEAYEKYTSRLNAPETDLIWDIFLNPVNLEPNPVPLKLITSNGDNVVVSKDIEQIIQFHEMDATEVTQLSSSSHLFFMHEERNVKEMNKSIIEFLAIL